MALEMREIIVLEMREITLLEMRGNYGNRNEGKLLS